jgi:2-iminobutanoate/2-iminopropanoate deaminase
LPDWLDCLSLSTGVPHHIGGHSDAVGVPAGYEQIILSGRAGLRADGGRGFLRGAAQAWRNVEAALSQAGAKLTEIISH